MGTTSLTLPKQQSKDVCANISKSLKTKQTSCWNISQLPFRNKCPALTFLKLWQRQLPPQKGSGTVVFYPTQFKKIFFFYRIQKFCRALVRLISHCASESSHLTLLHIFRCLSLNLLSTPAENKNISYNTQTQPGACRYSQFHNKYRDRYWVMHVLRENCSPSPLYWFRSQFLPPAHRAPALVGRAAAQSQLHTQQRSQPTSSVSLSPADQGSSDKASRPEMASIRSYTSNLLRTWDQKSGF